MILAEKIEATKRAGWTLPIRVVPCARHLAHALGEAEAWGIEEADGTLIAIVGIQFDADLIAEALNHVLVGSSGSVREQETPQ